MATNGDTGAIEQYASTGPADATQEQPSSSGGSNHDLPNEEVGWYFVEQYYTTLSKSPEKLHLFYGKRSQFVYGKEAEVASVFVGRQAIQERIKQLDIQQCKVRITNVDSLPSFDNIVIQVIGETSSKGQEEPKKFCQTFVLAKQPKGYFVLNDIWRFINEEDDEEQPEAAPKEAATKAADAPLVQTESEADSQADKAKEEASVDAPKTLDAEVVDKKLEEVSKDKEEPKEASEVPEAAPEHAKEASPEKATAEKTEPEAADAEAAARAVEEEDVKEAEKPADPSPTPVAPAPTTAPSAAPAAPAAEPEKPAAPAVAPKMTWASRVGAAAPKPALPLPKTATPPVAASARAPVPASKPGQQQQQQQQQQQPAATRPAEPAPQQENTNTQTAASAGANSGGEWQTAGADSKRQRPQSMISSAEKESTLGYVKYVTEKVQDQDLRAALSAFGPLTYFDINRPKNCAFVEFATPEGYKAAVAANPHMVNGENIYVEQRRPKSTAYGGTQYVSNRGGSSGRGRGGYDGPRSGSQGGARGGYGSMGRGRGGGGGPPRGGKVASQTAS